MSDFLSNLIRRRSARAATAGRPEKSVDELLAVAHLFDEAYYLATNPDVAAIDLSPLEHFFEVGFKEGRQPNPYFAPLWYAEQNPEIRETGIHPLVHYVSYGDRDGRSPSPRFDTSWYRTHYRLQDTELALLHYLQRRETYQYNPVPGFDVQYYLKRNPDILASGAEPFQHFIETGWREGRNPSADFDLKYYARRYMNGDTEENPLLHYLRRKDEAGVYGRRPDDEATIPREVKRFTQPGPDFEPFKPLPSAAERRAKLLALYLPQFHAIAENDAWWGTGFTEWTNVARGLPRFAGHYQPRIPRDLGFYSLDAGEPMLKQAELARAAGVHGFIFYYYWFNRRRLLQKPVDTFLTRPDINIDFALMWANENWTRRWDGHANDILISQDYRAEDEEFLLADFARHFVDPRYIRLRQRPLLMVYRPGSIPAAAEMFARWRRVFAERFGEAPIIVMAQGFGDLDPRVYGLDGAIEFPPHKLCEGVRNIADRLEFLDPEFSGYVHSYDDVVEASLTQPEPVFPLIRTVIPSWDNDARQQGAGMVISGSTPQKYQAWLSSLVADSALHPFFGERLVCVNAWNEWAEAAYLEPDQHYGAAYLNATGRAVAGIDLRNAPRILLVGHDAHPHGAQYNLLNNGQTLRRSFGVELEFLLLDGGALTQRYEAIAKTTIVKDDAALRAFFAALQARGFSSAIIHTSASARVTRIAAAHGFNCVLVIHEMPRLIRGMNLLGDVKTALQYASHTVFAAAFVRDEVLRALDLPGSSDRLVVYPQGIYKIVDFSADGAVQTRRELGLTDADTLVVGIGYADLRKGFDLFLQLWRLLRDAAHPIHFAWIGRLDPALEEWLRPEIDDAVATGTFHPVGFTEEIGDYLSAAGAFVLTSREDPFPSVVLEALSAGAPVVAFDRSGGIPELLRRHDAGVVVPYGDVIAMANALRDLLRRGPIPDADRAVRRHLVDTHFQYKEYAVRLLELAMPDLATVSVAVPNYNYARYLNARLGSIFAQTYPLREILVLDDCSTDDSVNVIKTVADDWDREIRLIVNQKNAGSVFAQWRKAAELATGEFLWIAEADDGCDPDFVASLCAPLIADRELRFAFADSRLIDTDGLPIGSSYKSYYSTVEPGALANSEIFDGASFVERFLSVKNLILNASAVVWRRAALLRALERCKEELPDFRMAGDWRLYLEALREPGAKVAYEAEPLNVHRRHSGSVTHALDARRHVDEISRVHALARDVFRLGRTRRADQSRYIVEVSDQFGITDDAAVPAARQGKRRRRRVYPAES